MDIGGRSVSVLVYFSFLVLGRQRIDFVPFSFSCASASIQITHQKKNGQSTDFGELGFFSIFPASTDFFTPLFFFCDFRVLITLRYLTPFNYSSFPSPPCSFAPSPYSSCSPLYVSVCVQALSTPCSLRPVPTTPQGFSPDFFPTYAALVFAFSHHLGLSADT